MTRRRGWIDADAYLFDIDGTLLNATGRAHYNAFTSALSAVFGLDATIDGVRWAGNTDVGILRGVLAREGIDTAQLDRRLDEVIAHMCEFVEQHRHVVRAEVCPSIDAVVRELHRAGKLLGVASGNFSRIGWIKIEAAGLRRFFDFGSFADKFPTRTEIFRAAITEVHQRLGKEARVCVVGDTPSDIESARANEVPVIAVATGGYTFAELEACAPDLCLPCCDDALPLEVSRAGV